MLFKYYQVLVLLRILRVLKYVMVTNSNQLAADFEPCEQILNLGRGPIKSVSPERRMGQPQMIQVCSVLKYEIKYIGFLNFLA